MFCDKWDYEIEIYYVCMNILKEIRMKNIKCYLFMCKSFAHCAACQQMQKNKFPINMLHEDVIIYFTGCLFFTVTFAVKVGLWLLS